MVASESVVPESESSESTSSESTETFIGFDDPQENWSRLPHAFIDALHIVTSLGELKVILYILRHTWGFQEDRRRLSVDDFMNGRKLSKGVRMDAGTGLARNSVRDGIRDAIVHGFIAMEEDATDSGRTRRYYRLRGRGEPLSGGSDIDLVSFCPPGGQKLTGGGSDSDPRTKKETKERQPRKKRGAKHLAPFSLSISPSLGQQLFLQSFRPGAFSSQEDADLVLDWETQCGMSKLEGFVKWAKPRHMTMRQALNVGRDLVPVWNLDDGKSSTPTSGGDKSMPPRDRPGKVYR